jgi:hypothetical protein
MRPRQGSRHGSRQVLYRYYTGGVYSVYLAILARGRTAYTYGVLRCYRAISGCCIGLSARGRVRNMCCMVLTKRDRIYRPF